MKRLALCLCLGLLGVAPSASSTERVPDRVMVTGTEYDLTLSRAKLTPGRAIVQFVNSGEDPHDLKIQRVGGKRETSLGVVPSSTYANLDLRLGKGSKYVLWCSLSDHRQRGMEATLRTRKRL